ncbi:MAG: GGDEF domain-containing protein [Gammaproteobacteria bacterium]|nr:GGDEF domain-containing protein [Gammaproteobacteria bacterium]
MKTNADILFFDKDCPLDAVVSLAEPRDVPGLNGAFLSILKEHIPNRAVKVYEILNNYCSPVGKQSVMSLKLIFRTQENNLAVKLDINETDVQECINSKEPVTGTSSTSGQTRSIFPIPGLNSPLGLLVIEGKVDESVKNFLDPLLRIYSSHAFILNRNETDSLTGLFNRHVMQNKLNQIYACQANGKRKNDGQVQSWCIALMDIDYFKKINDQFGHLFGDEVLIMFSRLMQNSFREDDMIFRYGGEEFLVALKNIDLDKAAITLERFRKQIESTSFNQVGNITVSIGFTAMNTSKPLSILVEQADRALYYCKYQGRNQISCYEQLLEKGLVDESNISDSNIELFPSQHKKIS